MTDESNCNSKQWIPVVIPNTGVLTMAYQAEDEYGLNDFCICRDDNGIWHIFAITYKDQNKFNKLSYLAHATADALNGSWVRQPDVYLCPTNNWAPHIIRDPGNAEKFIMFIGGTKFETLRIYESASRDLFNWVLRKDLGQLYGTRDPMVLYIEERKEYFMYATETTVEQGMIGICISSSKDAVNWERICTLPLGRNDRCDESPFVVKYDDHYYLWATWSSRNYYTGNPTRVFRSAYPDFRDIPDTGEDNCIYSMPLHAIEVVREEGEWYILQTGSGGPGIVLNKMRWGKAGKARYIHNDQLKYNGVWVYDSREHCRMSRTAGLSFEYAFKGIRVELRGDMACNGGKADVFIDGIYEGAVDMFAPHDIETQFGYYPDTFMWTSKDLEYGDHIFKVVIRPDKNPYSLDKFINVTGLIVY